MSSVSRRRSRAILSLLPLGLIAGCSPAGAPGRANADPVCAVILSTNDTHGRLEPEAYAWSEGREVGGAAALAGYLSEIRAASECPVFLLSGGDLMQGTLISKLTDGESTIAAMNALGYDAAAIGNHEFDWGVDVLKRRIAQAEFTLLGANIYRKDTGEHPVWARPWVIVERDGVRLGVVGATTTSTPVATKPDNVAHLEFGSIAEALDRYIPELREQGADFVVAVMHAGGFCDGDGACEGEALRELGQTSAIFDYAVLGHTHTRIATEVAEVPAVQSYANSTAFGEGRLERSADGRVSARLVEIHRTYVDGVYPDPRLVRLVKRYQRRVAGDLRRVVTTLAAPLGRFSRQGEYALGRLIADAQRAATGAQVAIMNNGGIRRALAAGPLSYEDLFELQPFQNTLVLLELRGRDLFAALEHAIDSNGRPDAHVSGLAVRYDPVAKSGRRVRSATLDDGSEVRPDGLYSVAVNDFMAAGGSGYSMFAAAESSVPTGIVDLDALVEYLGHLPRPVEAPERARWITSIP